MLFSYTFARVVAAPAGFESNIKSIYIIQWKKKIFEKVRVKRNLS